MKAKRTRVVIDARLISGEWGGVESVISGLAKGLSELDGPDEFHFMAYAGHDEWIRPHLAGPAQLVTVGVSAGAATRRLKRRIKTMAPFLIRAWGNRPLLPSERKAPTTDGTAERLRADVVHLMLQSGFRTTIPSIYHPHDLQHVHLPQFFTPAQRRWRDALYEDLCRQAEMVAVVSTWTKRDVESHFKLDPGKVVVVPFAPPLDAFPELQIDEVERIAGTIGAPSGFVLYPAQTWPHKNHIRLIQALGILRDRGRQVPLVATGLQNESSGKLRQRAQDLGLQDLIAWKGYVTAAELQVLYRTATAVVIPSLFEAASAPLWEAFRYGVPAACSNVTSLPDQAGDAAILFDPMEPQQIADAIDRIVHDGDLRARVIERGKNRVREFTWRGSALRFRAHYRRLARAPLSDEDRYLIQAPPGI